MSRSSVVCPVIKAALNDAVGGKEVQLGVVGMTWSPLGELMSFDEETGEVVINTGGALTQRLTLHAANVIAVGVK